ncbi:hypothetical protein BRD56_02840 [Thermoplasmatales archaeon SW_10_69_26]|nr:MAG: hypothetical protein BRD56_02840 [Thermoplasmatales archaeon SW_10_69_26]
MSRTRSLAAEERSAEETDTVTAADLDDPVERAEWLQTVLQRTFEMDEEDARRISGLVVDQFGAKDEVLDDEVPKEVRSVFYTLESKRILTFRRIEYEGEDGMRKRGFFWQFHPEGVEAELETEAADDEDAGVYDNLPEDCWDRGDAGAAA